jgi:outer membrane protein OmpU
MNNFKKIGLTALAASLVSTSVFAGELTATGSASMTVEGYSGTILESDTAWSMADSVTLGGSTELDNGLTVSMAFELDGDAESGTSAYDDNSLTISSDALGTLKFSAHGGSSATSAIDATAAGNIWDTFDGTLAVDGLANGLTSNGVTDGNAAAGENSFHYTAPAMVDGLALMASLNTGQGTANAGHNAIGWATTYTGFDGLSVSYGISDIKGTLATTTGDQTVMKASYAYGPVTLAYSENEIDLGLDTTDKITTSWGLSYTVSDALSVTYGVETIDLSGATDAEYEGITASYTAGGMTMSVSSKDATNIDNTVDDDNDYDYWSLGLSFAF